MIKHTPGPWWRDDDGFVAAGAGDTYVTIADPNCSDLDIDEREANCSLIAAAPDMLAALTDLMNLIDQMHANDGVVRALAKANLGIAASQRKQQGRSALTKAMGLPS